MSTEPEWPIPEGGSRDSFVGTVEGADFYKLQNNVAIITAANGPVATYHDCVNWEKVTEKANE